VPGGARLTSAFAFEATVSALDPGRIQDELPQLVDRLASEFARLFTYFRIPAQDAEDLLRC
jgi:hypothetical protein